MESSVSHQRENLFGPFFRQNPKEVGHVVRAEVFDQPGDIRVQQVRQHLIDAVAVEFAEHLSALRLASHQFEDFPLFFGGRQMHNDLRHIGLMHPAQHLRKIGDRTSMQQPLHRQQHDVGFGPASIGLVTQRVAEEIFIP